jgi:hypothetical protein
MEALMKRAIILYSMLLSFLFQCCTNKAPLNKDIVGIWESKDGSILEIYANGTFSAKSFSTIFLYYTNLKYPNQFFDGSGKWKIVNGQTHWELDLNFLQTSIKESRIGTNLLICGSGILERTPPWKNLFLWKGEEGGERYEFIKCSPRFESSFY